MQQKMFNRFALASCLGLLLVAAPGLSAGSLGLSYGQAIAGPGKSGDHGGGGGKSGDHGGGGKSADHGPKDKSGSSDKSSSS